MSRSKKSINVYYLVDSIDLDLIKNVLNLSDDYYELIPKKVDLNFKADELSLFISKKINEKYYLKPDLFIKEGKSEETFFYFPKLKKENHFFEHKELSKFRESYEFAGVSYSFGFKPKTNDYDYLLFFLKDGKRALFLDRDGVLNTDTGYVGDVEQLTVLDWLCPVIKKCNEGGIPVIVLTNQAGVARGYFSKEDVKNVNEKIRSTYLENKARIDDIFISYSHPDGMTPFNYKSLFRKPMFGMAASAASKFSINTNKSLMIGDKTTDNHTPFVGNFLLLESKYHSSGLQREEALHEIKKWLEKKEV